MLIPFSELSRELSSINDNGAIKNFDAREDGVYITYDNGTETITKKLKIGSDIAHIGSLTGESATFDLSGYTGYKTFNFYDNIIGCDKGSYDPITGTLIVQNTKVDSGKITISGSGYVMDSGIKRTGSGQMTGSCKMYMIKEIYLVK